ncbi:MAG: TonB-dependent receptor [Chitinophagaceae bacterium]|nr:TonB-dependent receptor [Chitinophagaceae bacterium]
MRRIFQITGLLLLLLSFLQPLTSNAQGKLITGTVVSGDNKLPLQGVNISVKGAKTSTATDAQGNFKITAAPGAVLVFTSASYLPYEVTVGADATVEVTLQPDTKAMSDVVVIGYQTVRRKDLLASVSSVGAKDLKDIPINSAAEALNGRLAGVTATTAEGAPDADVRIRVRGGMSITGDNSPLYVIDGVQVENALNFISPQDIQSIDVLKDAAATAIYGARGANGVIVITTKSGKIGRAIVTYNGFVGVKSLAKRLKVLDPYDFVFYQSERARGSSTDSNSFLRNYGTTWDTLGNYRNIDAVDWQGEIFGNTGITTTHNLGVSGGNKMVTYNFGYTYNNEKAIVINSNYKRHLFTFKGDYKLTKFLKIGLGARYTHQEVEGAGVSDAKGSSYSRLRNAVKYRPFLSANQDIEDQDPLADQNVGNGLNLYNPISLANSEYRKKTTDVLNVNGTLTLTLAKGLIFRSTAAYDINKFTDLQFNDSITPYAIIQGGRKAIASLDTVTKKTLTNSNVLSYSLKGWKGKHDIDVLVGEETFDLRTESHSSLFRNYPLFTSSTDAFKNTSLGTSFTGFPRTNETRYTNLSFFGRFSYGLLGRYLVSFNVRADGASKFVKGKQWGYFPAASAAWRIKNEKFLKDVRFISELKLRYGYGKVGNNRINDYLFLTTFRNDGTYYYGVNGQAINAYFSNGLVNQNLQWESTVSRNYGVDLGLGGRIDLSVDVYSNTSDKLLLNVPIPSTFGYTSQLQNIGKTTNKGVEVQLNAALVRHKNFTWNANFNISFNKNKIVGLGVNQTQFFPAASWGVSGQPTDYIEKIGSPVGSIYGLVTAGYYTTDDFNYNAATMVYTLKPGIPSNSSIIGTVMPGSIKFADLNKDGVVDINNDRTIIGDPTPKCTGGFSQQFTLKGWDLSMFLNYSIGNDIYNANAIEMTNGYSINSNMLAIMKDRYKVVTPTGGTALWLSGSNVMGIPPDQLSALNKDANIWQPLKSAGAFYPHSWAIENGSFVRLNNMTIGYTFPMKKALGVKMTKLRVYLTGNNIATITNYTGYDPEVSVRSNPLTPGLDYSAYPKSRTFIFGVNATF